MRLRENNYEELVFQGRHKLYGAYVLRKTYAARMLFSLITTISIVSLFFAGLLWIGHLQKQHNKAVEPKFKGPVFVAKAIHPAGPCIRLTII